MLIYTNIRNKELLQKLKNYCRANIGLTLKTRKCCSTFVR
jgi:hypothetical protein